MSFKMHTYIKRNQISELDAKLFASALNGNINNVVAFLQRGASAEAISRTTLLTSLAERGLTQVIEVLLDAGADPNAAIPETGITALMWAARAGHWDTVNLLLEKGANIDAFATGAYGSEINALMYAALKGHVQIVNLLIERGADVNARLEFGTSALMWAARNGHIDIVQKLVECGAEVNAVTKSNVTALGWAKKHHHTLVALWLEQTGAEEKRTSWLNRLQDAVSFYVVRLFSKFVHVDSSSKLPKPPN